MQLPGVCVCVWEGGVGGVVVVVGVCVEFGGWWGVSQGRRETVEISVQLPGVQRGRWLGRVGVGAGGRDGGAGGGWGCWCIVPGKRGGGGGEEGVRAGGGGIVQLPGGCVNRQGNAMKATQAAAAAAAAAPSQRLRMSHAHTCVDVRLRMSHAHTCVDMRLRMHQQCVCGFGVRVGVVGGGSGGRVGCIVSRK